MFAEVRAREAHLDPADVAAVRGMRLLNFSPPCQVRVFHIAEPMAFFTIIAHVPSGPDGDIWVSRPLRLYELFQEFERVAQEPLWDAPLPSHDYAILQPGEEPTFRPVVEQALVNAFSHAERLPFIRPREALGGMMSTLGGHGATWWYDANLTQLDPIAFATQNVTETIHEIESYRHRMEEIQAHPRPAPPPAASRRSRHKYGGWGIWLYPRLRIGPRPRGSLWERMRFGSFALDNAPVSILIEMGDTRLLVATHDGFVGIHLDPKHQQVKFQCEVEDLLNALAYSLVETGFQSYVVLESEFEGFELDLRDGAHWLSRRLMPHTYRTTSSPLDELFPGGIQHVSIPEFTQLVRAAQAVIGSSRLNHARLVVDAATHLQRGHPTESFFHSWLLIEQLVNEDWEGYLSQCEVTTDRRPRLIQPDRWTADTKMEVLDLAGALGLDYNAAMASKKLRNDVLHGKKRATHEDALRAFEVARKSLAARLPLNLPDRRKPETDSREASS